MIGEPDEASYLPGRNVLLLAKPLLWCALNGVPELATAPLASNPFPDATDAFYDGMAKLVGDAVTKTVRVLRPYAMMGLHKADVVKRGREMPLAFTLSCAKPVRGMNCGFCSKCGERKDGFTVAGIPDPTRYATNAK
jgi:7-cyano-7-deazaguanine synthase